MAVGMHKVGNYNIQSPNIPTLLRPSRNVVDVGDIIHTWWGLFYLDRAASLLGEFPVTIPRDETVVTTVWPCKFADYANGVAMRTPYSGIATLLSYPAETTRIDSVYTNVFAFRAKSIALLYHAIKLASSCQDEHMERTREVHITTQVTLRLSEAMLAYRKKACPTFTCSRDYEDDGHDGTLICAMSTAYAALIQLFNVSADKDAESYQRRLVAARACAALGVEARQTDPSLLNVVIHLSWCASYEVLAWEMVRLNTLGETEAATTVRSEVETIMDLLRLSAQYFDIVKLKWTIQNLRRFDIHTTELAQWSKR